MTSFLSPIGDVLERAELLSAVNVKGYWEGRNYIFFLPPIRSRRSYLEEGLCFMREAAPLFHRDAEAR